jgi:hypothetical protein
MTVADANGSARAVTLHDVLPPMLTIGAARPLLYRIQLNNATDRNAGWSQPAYTLAGAAPPAVQNLSAEGTRQGILLRWQSAASPQSSAPIDVRVRREIVGAPAAASTKSMPLAEPLWLATHAETTGATAGETLDASAQENIRYRYVAVRRQIVQIDDRRLELRSAPSAPADITLRDIFPPPIPTDLNAAPFTQSGQFAIDLVWQPVSDPGLAGYNVTRQTVDANGTPIASSQRLNSSLVTLPAYHDATAISTEHYRYNVSSVDFKGNESATASIDVEPQPQ